MNEKEKLRIESLKTLLKKSTQVLYFSFRKTNQYQVFVVYNNEIVNVSFGISKVLKLRFTLDYNISISGTGYCKQQHITELLNNTLGFNLLWRSI